MSSSTLSEVITVDSTSKIELYNRVHADDMISTVEEKDFKGFKEFQGIVIPDIFQNLIDALRVFTKWEQKHKQLRSSTNNILNNFRGCYVFEKLGKSFSDFIVKQRQIINTINPIFDAVNPLFYIRR